MEEAISLSILSEECIPIQLTSPLPYILTELCNMMQKVLCEIFMTSKEWKCSEARRELCMEEMQWQELSISLPKSPAMLLPVMLIYLLQTTAHSVIQQA